jgi:hypothetical protein
MDAFHARAVTAVAAFLVIGVASVVVSAQQRPEIPVVGCIERAERETLLAEEDIQALCFGASSPGPSACYEAALDRLTLSNVEGIRLCRCAGGPGPVDCFEGVRDQTDVFIDQAIVMCSEITVRRLRFDCTPIPVP